MPGHEEVRALVDNTASLQALNPKTKRSMFFEMLTYNSRFRCPFFKARKSIKLTEDNNENDVFKSV
jgi:hypothetical protein